MDPVQRRSLKRGSFGIIVAAAVLALALAGLVAGVVRPPTARAQQALGKARALAGDAAAGGVKTFVLSEETRSRPTARVKAEVGSTGDEQLRSESRQWYEAPNRWRIETTGTATRPDGQE
ncbi:MAG: hypothetical protein ACRDIY_14475, partial [Chloroflexota bacterium]